MTDYLRFFEWDDLVLSTFCYYLGRGTANARAFADHLGDAWPELPKNVQRIIRRKLERALRLDAAWLNGPANDPADRAGWPIGDQADREAWRKVEAAWTS